MLAYINPKTYRIHISFKEVKEVYDWIKEQGFHCNLEQVTRRNERKGENKSSSITVITIYKDKFIFGYINIDDQTEIIMLNRRYSQTEPYPSINKTMDRFKKTLDSLFKDRLPNLASIY